MFQAGIVEDADFGCDWAGTPIPIQRYIMYINVAANKMSQLIGGKFVPVSNVTMFCVWSRLKLAGNNITGNVYSDIRQQVIYFVILFSNEAKLPQGFCMP